ncbi:disulfide bond formation protein B [Marivivens marinus]|uniref:disulfide bond formation protein B n=1 Tax=Marivivens marinus TaxID=3110173 RepID=UPI003B8466F6
MTRTRLILLAAGGSFALLAGAFLFQALGWAPCKMCLWQRYPHGAAIGIGALALLGLGWRILPWLGGLAALTTAGIGMYHSGVEQKWWDGPASCTASGGALDGLSGASLLPGAAAEAPALVLCDTFTPFLFGLSMANWNTILSVGLVVLWLMAARRA